jgi:adenylyltransferase/sulfurtransferase
MTDSGEDFLLIDVREPGEYEIVSIPGSVLIPKGQFLDGSALEHMPQDRKIVVNCKTGVRSAEVLAVLKGAGFANSVHLGGGVVQWVRQVEPEKPIY